MAAALELLQAGQPAGVLPVTDTVGAVLAAFTGPTFDQKGELPWLAGLALITRFAALRELGRIDEAAGAAVEAVAALRAAADAGVGPLRRRSKRSTPSAGRRSRHGRAAGR